MLRDAAAAILAPGDDRVSLKAKARELRDRGEPTVTGAPWTASTLRDVLKKACLAGVTDARGNVVVPAILTQDQSDRLRELFKSRENPGTSNAPRWLVSCYATCGVCGSVVKCTGGGRPQGVHLRRARSRPAQR